LADIISIALVLRFLSWCHSCQPIKFQVSNGAGRLSHRPVDLDLQTGPSAIPDEIPVSTGYLMRICKTLHSNYRAGYYYSHNPKCMCMCVCIRGMLLSSLVLYFDNAPSLILASFLCQATQPPGRQDCAGTPIERVGSSQPPSSQPTAHSPRGWNISVH